jgi:hypothetical protein
LFPNAHNAITNHAWSKIDDKAEVPKLSTGISLEQDRLFLNSQRTRSTAHAIRAARATNDFNPSPTATQRLVDEEFRTRFGSYDPLPKRGHKASSNNKKPIESFFIVSKSRLNDRACVGGNRRPKICTIFTNWIGYGRSLHLSFWVYNYRCIFFAIYENSFPSARWFPLADYDRWEHLFSKILTTFLDRDHDHVANAGGWKSVEA